MIFWNLLENNTEFRNLILHIESLKVTMKSFRSDANIFLYQKSDIEKYKMDRENLISALEEYFNTTRRKLNDSAGGYVLSVYFINCNGIKNEITIFL